MAKHSERNVDCLTNKKQLRMARRYRVLHIVSAMSSWKPRVECRVEAKSVRIVSGQHDPATSASRFPGTQKSSYKESSVTLCRKIPPSIG